MSETNTELWNLQVFLLRKHQPVRRLNEGKIEPKRRARWMCDDAVSDVCFWCLYSSRATSTATVGWRVEGNGGQKFYTSGLIVTYTNIYYT